MDSMALEVGIGLAVVFFVTATVVTAINEMLTRLLNVRSKALWTTLERLLEKQQQGMDKKSLSLGFLKPALSPGAGPRPKVQPAGAATPAAELASTPSIRALDYAHDHTTTKVWNIPTSVFVGALLEVAKTEADGQTLQAKVDALTAKYADSPLGSYLAQISEAGATSLDSFTSHVGAWFDGQMERLTDSYRRLTKYLLAGIGLGIAVAFNVNTLAVVTGLADNAEERQAVVLLAGDLDQSELSCPAKPGDSVSDAQKAIACATNSLSSFDALDVHSPLDQGWRGSWSWGGAFWHVVGLLLTALAVGLGGPFWFDTVGALAGLRRRQT